MLKWFFALLTAASIAVAASAQGGLESKIVNTGTWNAWGAKTKVRSDDTVEGGFALRVYADKGGNPWDASAAVAISKPIKKGDVLLAYFLARVEKAPEGRSTASLPAISIQMAGAPYTGLFSEPAEITGKWEKYYVSGVADRDYDAGQLNLTVQLAADKQVIDLGPVAIIDLGPNFDLSKLPHNRVAAAAPPPADDGQTVIVCADCDRGMRRAAEAETRFADALNALRAKLPVKGILLNDPGQPLGVYGPDQTNSVIDAADVPGGKAVRVVAKRGSDPWSDGGSVPIYGEIHKGDTVQMAVYVRAAEVTNEAQAGVVSSMGIQLTRNPWTPVASTAVSVPHNEWRVFYVSGIATTHYAPGEASASFQFGCCNQTLDIGPIFVLNLGQGVDPTKLPQNRISYLGREANAPWRAAAEARIKKLRMGEMTLQIVDAAGKPVQASVHVAMQRHLFHFGAFAGYDLTADTPRSEALRTFFLDHFEFATSPVYWSDWGWQNPSMKKIFLDTARWLHDRGIPMRAHTVIYPNEYGTPKYIKALAGDPAAAKKAVLTHVRDTLETMKPFHPCCYDMFNEPRDGVYLPSLAGADIAADAFKAAHAVDPEAKLFANEYGIVSGGGMNEKYIEGYRKWIADMIAKGAPVGGIGIQSHFGAQLTPIDRAKAILDEFAKFNLPIQITEFDVETTDEDAQADYTRDYLTLAFSHPAVDAVVTWDWRGGDANNPRTMIRADGSEKPNGAVWRKLVRHDWWTDETVTTGADGGGTLRAFYGEYRITVTVGGKSVTKTVSFAPGSGAIKLVVE